MKTFPRMKRCTVLTIACLLWSLPMPPPTEAMEDLTELSIEELANIEVTSVSRKPQKLSHAATAIFVITGDDIRRSGVTSIPDALRMAPGIQVARISSSKWAISSRGFNSRYSNKLLVQMDGRTLYSPSSPASSGSHTPPFLRTSIALRSFEAPVPASGEPMP